MQFHGGFHTDSFDTQPMRESPLVCRARLLAVTGASSGDRARTEKSGHGTAGPCLHRAPSCGGFWVYFSRTRRWRPPSKGTRGTRPGRGGFLAEVACGQGAEAGVRVRGRGEAGTRGDSCARLAFGVPARPWGRWSTRSAEAQNSEHHKGLAEESCGRIIRGRIGPAGRIKGFV